MFYKIGIPAGLIALCYSFCYTYVGLAWFHYEFDSAASYFFCVFQLLYAMFYYVPHLIFNINGMVTFCLWAICILFEKINQMVRFNFQAIAIKPKT